MTSLAVYPTCAPASGRGSPPAFVVQSAIFVLCVLLFRRGIIGELAHILRIRL